MKKEAIEVAKKTKQTHSMQLNGKFVSMDMALRLGWISKRTGEVTQKYLKHKESLVAKKARLAAKAESEKQAKILAKEKAKAKKERAKEKELQAKADAKAKILAKKEREKQRIQKAKEAEEAKIQRAKEKVKAKEDKIQEQLEAKAKREETLARFQKEAEEAGLPIPKRLPRKQKKAQVYEANDGTLIPSPYDLERRSGYKVIWQVLAERHDEVVSNEELHAEVNKRLSSDPESAEWYHDKYSSRLDELGQPEEYPVIINAATVMTRPPYNGVNKKNHSIINPISLEGLNQRIIAGTRGIMLKTNVQDRYISKTAKKALESTQTTSV
jgi:hypothetical protein